MKKRVGAFRVNEESARVRPARRGGSLFLNGTRGRERGERERENINVRRTRRKRQKDKVVGGEKDGWDPGRVCGSGSRPDREGDKREGRKVVAVTVAPVVRALTAPRDRVRGSSVLVSN